MPITLLLAKLTAGGSVSGTIS